MKSRLLVRGTVFNYPYLWRHQRNHPPDHPKNRPACLLFKLPKPSGQTMLVIIAISDLEEKSEGGCLKVPEAEMASSGLSQFRNAYVHVLEYNVDRETHSVTYLPRDGVKGRFSKPFIERIAKALAENIRLGRAAQIVRN